MAELTVGLAANRTSYFDPITNTYITLEKPVQKVTYNEADVEGTVKRLEKITHALLASIPALVLYEGQLPEACIEHFKAKYTKPLYGRTSRNIVASSIVGGTTPLPEALQRNEVLGTVPVADPIRNGVDDKGRVLNPNQVFDRADKAKGETVEAPVETPEEPEVEGASLSKAEIVEEQDLLSLAEEPKEEVKTTRKSSRSKSTKQ